METANPPGTQARSSSGSVRPHGSRSTNPDKQISQIEKSVTHLLVATKQLLETLTQWSRGTAQEEEVSDVYVRLGYEFNLACRAFNSIGVETTDLGPVPDLLRSILEDTLSQPASPQALDNYLPRIRDIIINLLHGLKRKQSKLRSRPPRDGSNKPPSGPSRQTSLTTEQPNDANLESTLDSVSGQPIARSDSRLDSLRFSDEPQTIANDPPRMTSINRNSFNRPSQRTQTKQASSSESTFGTSAFGTPTVSTGSDSNRTPYQNETPFPHAPPPPPKQDALTALQRGPDLERRASRRFSAYQIQKHLGASPNGVPVIPPAQHSPIPNRGREAKESLSAVRSRTSFTTKRSATRLQEISPTRDESTSASQRISEERESEASGPVNKYSKIELPGEDSGSYSPTVKTPDEYVGSGGIQRGKDADKNGPVSTGYNFPRKNESDPEAAVTTKAVDDILKRDVPAELSADMQQLPRSSSTPSPTVMTVFNTTPPQGKELTLFLQYKSKIKKFILSEGFEGLSMARLQLAFIEKFAWNTHNNGVDLPEIYIQDPVSGVRHELEDLSDIRDRCVLVLNFEVLDEVKKHFDDGIGGLKSTLDSVRILLDGQGSMLQRFSDRQLETSKEMARLSTAPTTRPSRAATAEIIPIGVSHSSETAIAELAHLRRDIAVLRQTYSTMSTDFTATMSDLKSKASVVKEVAAAAAAPSYEGNAGRSHVNQGKKQLSTDSEALVNRVDDLTDLVEDLRKDVVTRGVRPLPRQLEDISKEVTATNRQLAKMKEFLKREKPIWTKIWENELDQVCTERDDLTQQEDLMSDLDGDLQDVTGVFKLVEEAMKQQALQTPGNARNTSKQFEYEASMDPQAAKDGMLHEVRALKVNHEGRLEAIERAERVRQRELENRAGGEFQREVKEFVEEGKLKKVGGMDEVERLRKIKDEKAIKENWVRQQAREAEREKKRQAEAAAKAATEAAAKEQAREEGNSHTTDDSISAAPIEQSENTETANAFENVSGSSSLAHQATTLPQSEVSDSSATTSSDKNAGTESKYSSGPPQLPDLNISGSSELKDDVNHSVTTEVSKSSSKPDLKDDSKPSSWWKPAVF